MKITIDKLIQGIINLSILFVIGLIGLQSDFPYENPNTILEDLFNGVVFIVGLVLVTGVLVFLYSLYLHYKDVVIYDFK